MTAEAWIALVVRRYEFFVKHAHAEEIADQCPEVPAFYAILETLHERCLKFHLWSTQSPWSQQEIFNIRPERGQ